MHFAAHLTQGLNCLVSGFTYSCHPTCVKITFLLVSHVVVLHHMLYTVNTELKLNFKKFYRKSNLNVIQSDCLFCT